MRLQWTFKLFKENSSLEEVSLPSHILQSPHVSYHGRESALSPFLSGTLIYISYTMNSSLAYLLRGLFKLPSFKGLILRAVRLQSSLAGKGLPFYRSSLLVNHNSSSAQQLQSAYS